MTDLASHASTHRPIVHTDPKGDWTDFSSRKFLWLSRCITYLQLSVDICERGAERRMAGGAFTAQVPGKHAAIAFAIQCSSSAIRSCSTELRGVAMGTRLEQQPQPPALKQPESVAS
jgi:hypothetical protein